MSVSTQGAVSAPQITQAESAARLWQGARLRYFAGMLSVLGGLLAWELISRLFVANPLFLAAP